MRIGPRCWLILVDMAASGEMCKEPWNQTGGVEEGTQRDVQEFIDLGNNVSNDALDVGQE